MKLCIAFVVLAIVTCSIASPIEPQEQEHGMVHSRMRRVTCDLLSPSTPWGSVNHAACALHCLALRQGYKGGRCIDGVCNCRR